MCVHTVMYFFLVIVSISYTEILPSRECAWATGERLPNRKPISISTISSTAHRLKFHLN